MIQKIVALLTIPNLPNIVMEVIQELINELSSANSRIAHTETQLRSAEKALGEKEMKISELEKSLEMHKAQVHLLERKYTAVKEEIKREDTTDDKLVVHLQRERDFYKKIIEDLKKSAGDTGLAVQVKELKNSNEVLHKELIQANAVKDAYRHALNNCVAAVTDAKAEVAGIIQEINQRN